MAHKTKSLLLSCIDFRFQKEMENFLEIDEDSMDNYDHIAIAGAILTIVEPEKQEYKDYLLKQIDISVKLHDPDTIYLINHEDCGAYGENNSKERHESDLIKAKQILQELYPNKKIRIFIAKFNEIEEIS